MHWQLGYISCLIIMIILIGVAYIFRKQEKSIAIVIPSYNNAQWYDLNLSSVFIQKYRNYRIIYIDDNSSDDTYNLVMKKIKDAEQQNRVTVMRNEQRRGSLANIYRAIHEFCTDDEIVVLLDGDDWFKDEHVLQKVADAYDDPRIWMTYGQYEEFPGRGLGLSRPIPDQIIQQNAYRKFTQLASHLRTFKAWLFKKIKKEDFMFEGDFFQTTGDLAILFPLLEMAAGHWKFISDVLYVYNMATPLNDYKTRFELQQQCHKFIRNKPCYRPLKKPLLVEYKQPEWYTMTSRRTI